MKFSIIVPSYNRQQQVSKLLDAFGKLSVHTPGFEVIIVDDGSQPPLSISTNAYDYPLTVIRQDNFGPAKARNTGAESARGRYLAFIDDDCLPHSDWLMGFNELCNGNNLLLLGGQTINGLENNPYSQATQVLFDFLVEHYHPSDHPGGFFPANNILVPKALFHTLNGFDPALRFGEDRHFCYRWTLKNQSFKSVPKALIFHFHNLNFFSFLKLHFNYGCGSLGFRRLITRELDQPVPIADFIVYLRLIFCPFKQSRGIRPAILSILLFCTQAANACGMISRWCMEYFKIPGKTG